MIQIHLEILEYSYWEHLKYAKDLALIFQPDHPKRLRVQEELNKMIEQINEAKRNNKDN